MSIREIDAGLLAVENEALRSSLAAAEARVREVERERDEEREWAKGVGDCLVAVVKRAETAEARADRLEKALRRAREPLIFFKDWVGLADIDAALAAQDEKGGETTRCERCGGRGYSNTGCPPGATTDLCPSCHGSGVAQDAKGEP